MKLKLQSARTGTRKENCTPSVRTVNDTTTPAVDRRQQIPRTTANRLSVNSSLLSPGLLSSTKPHVAGLSPIISTSKTITDRTAPSRDSGDNFLPPPCGDSFFEESMALPSTLATFKERNSPSITKPSLVSSEGKKFSFKKPGLPATAASSTPTPQRTGSFSTNTSPTNYIPELNDMDTEPAMTQPKSSNFAFDYKISENSSASRITSHNENTHSNSATGGTKFVDEDSFNWDDVPSDIEEYLNSPTRTKRSVTSITKALPASLNTSKNSFGASFMSPGKCYYSFRQSMN